MSGGGDVDFSDGVSVEELGLSFRVAMRPRAAEVTNKIAARDFGSRLPRNPEKTGYAICIEHRMILKKFWSC